LSMDVDAARNDVLAAGRRLLARHPEVGALVLECTNMPPYAAELSQALGLPVFDFYSFVTWFHTGLRPRRFAQP
ncbi:MAG: aspartate/glutamate racemase family protein, partial [Chromatiales bacterium]|nr:aspartate/glutamate racemase family protein [Chromatiales bacterium]